MHSFSDVWRRLTAHANHGPHPEGSPTSILDVLHVLKAFDIRNAITLKDTAVDGLTHAPLDDKTYLMERIIQLASELPVNTAASQTLTEAFLSQLWSDLQHPPKTYLGRDSQYRKADGSGNNILWPHIGAAGQTYARSVKPEKLQPVRRPDPAVIFESVLKRKSFRPHPNKLSSILFYLASVIIHDLFHTSHDDPNVSHTSSYLDLAPLYGSDEDGQKSVRTMKDGMLKPDCFADERPLGFPPGVGLLLIMFNRFHNNVAENLARIDESERFSHIRRPSRSDPSVRDDVAYDEALFQTARLITSGLYVNIILKDYVRTILNLNRVDSDWDLDPRSDQGKSLFPEKIPLATGNQVSAEFNLIYRWHSCVSERDDLWSKDMFAKLFPSNTTPSMPDFLEKLGQWSEKLKAMDPPSRPFANLQRDATGRYADHDLAAIWSSGVQDPAGAFGANNVPAILKQVEVLGILQSRSWNLASLNEFRKYFNLKPYESFEEINPDPEVADQLRRLYEHPDDVEIYPGVIVEATKDQLIPGSGLCTNYTVSRAILSDAVALLRGDRFYTADYIPQNLTNHGFTTADYDVRIDNGCVMYKLVLGAFPNHVQYDSIYAHYPMIIPDENRSILSKLGQLDKYDLECPTSLPTNVVIQSYDGCKTLLHGSIGSAASITMSLGEGYVEDFFEKTLTSLMRKHTYRMGGVNEIDIVKVFNLAQVQFVSCLFALPLNTEDNPRAKFKDRDMISALTSIYCIDHAHARGMPADDFKTREVSRAVRQELQQLVEYNVHTVEAMHGGIISNIVDMLHEQSSSDLTDQSVLLIRHVLRNGINAREAASWLVSTAATVMVTQAQAFADCLDYLLGTPILLSNVRRLSLLDSGEADDQIEHYALEAVRINTVSNLYVRVADKMALQDGSTRLTLSNNQVVACDLPAANHDPRMFPAPDVFDPKRDLDSYLPRCGNAARYPGEDAERAALIAMLRTVGRLPMLRRVTGPVGRLRRVRTQNGNGAYLSLDESVFNVIPDSMKLNFGQLA